VTDFSSVQSCKVYRVYLLPNCVNLSTFSVSTVSVINLFIFVLLRLNTTVFLLSTYSCENYNIGRELHGFMLGHLCFWPDCKPEGPLFSAEFVCLSVSVSDRHFYPSTLTDFDET